MRSLWTKYKYIHIHGLGFEELQTSLGETNILQGKAQLYWESHME